MNKLSFYLCCLRFSSRTGDFPYFFCQLKSDTKKKASKAVGVLLTILLIVLVSGMFIPLIAKLEFHDSKIMFYFQNWIKNGTSLLYLSINGEKVGFYAV